MILWNLTMIVDTVGHESYDHVHLEWEELTRHTLVCRPVLKDS